LDNVVHRLGFAPTLLSARQLVLHGHVLVNGRKVDHPSYTLRPGETLSLKEKTKKMLLVEEGLVRSPARPVVPYIQVEKENFKGMLTSVPERSQIPLEINEALIMEHYTRYL
jgi:small subunit ribosomal protein S4